LKLRGVTKKKLDCIDHTFDSIPSGKPIVHVIWFACFRYFCNLVLVNQVKISLLGVAFIGRLCCLLSYTNGTSTKMEQQIN